MPNESPIYMTVTLNVKGEEEMTVTLEYKNTNLKTVKLVENAIMSALMNINNQ